MWILAMLGCRGTGPPPHSPGEVDLADVVSVEVSGDSGAYTFAVGIESRETGCDRYADWWEVLSESGDLLTRRILGHSHPNEQPFVRSGGPVEIEASEQVWVRAHLAPEGYGGAAMFGSPDEGFALSELVADWSALESVAPQPSDCAF